MTATAETKAYEAPRGATKTHSSPKLGFDYETIADWIVLKKDEKPIAEVFSTYYRKAGPLDPKRPITFVFNGGPGASSAFLHLGCVGPRRLVMEAKGDIPKSPAQLVENTESWLSFTDLCFVDPVGTGFSRALPEDPTAKDAKPTKEFFSIRKDIESLCDFIQKFLSKMSRWASPAFIAGESYGGYRMGRLARRLQETTGVGLNGTILISPAMELGQLNFNDYEVVPFAQVYPSYVLTAVHHGRSKAFAKGTPHEKVLKEAVDFALGPLSTLLMSGESLDEKTRASTIKTMSDHLGISEAFIALHGGRLGIEIFSRELLRSERTVVGLYDSTITATDPFPDRGNFEGADPTLWGIDRVFASAANALIRDHLGVSTDREYRLLSMEVFKSWQITSDDQAAFDLRDLGSTDDLRYAVCLNDHMKVFITHGYFDLVTPYFASERLYRHMKLTPQQRQRFTIEHFNGGHMFYTWDESRIAFKRSIEKFYAAAL